MTETQKRRLILQLVERWVTPMWLTEWTVKVEFPTRMKYTATCTASPEYLQCVLSFNLQRMPDDLDQIREMVCHEMTHPTTWALAELAFRGARRTAERREAIRKAEEQLTTRVSRMMLPHLPSHE